MEHMLDKVYCGLIGLGYIPTYQVNRHGNIEPPKRE